MVQRVGIWDEIFGFSSGDFLNLKEQNIPSGFLKPKPEDFWYSKFPIKTKIQIVKKLKVILLTSCVSIK